MSDRKHRRMTAGLVLITVGLGLFFLERVDGIGDEAILLVIGSAFLIAYLIQKRYGLLIPAGVLLGLGVGSVAENSLTDIGDSKLIGLGLGFFAIYVVSRVYGGRSHWWPLIPGSLLLLVGIPETRRLFDYLFDHWQLVLVLIGVLLLIGAFRGGGD